jgi:hypothetical protein
MECGLILAQADILSPACDTSNRPEKGAAGGFLDCTLSTLSLFPKALSRATSSISPRITGPRTALPLPLGALCQGDVISQSRARLSCNLPVGPGKPCLFAKSEVCHEHHGMTQSVRV